MLIDFSLDCIETKYVTFNYKYIDYDFMISFNFFFKNVMNFYMWSRLSTMPLCRGFSGLSINRHKFLK